MANITAAEVAKLRKQTGAGMMDCKKALQESEGDFEKAIEILRKKGAKVAAKRADKDATEGYVLGKTSNDNTFGVLVMVNCETDFVAKSEDFVNFVTGITTAALDNKAETLEAVLALTLDNATVAEKLNDITGKTGEKLEFDSYKAIKAPFVSAYNHNGNRIATLVGMNKAGEGVDVAAHDLAMQIAAMNPVSLDKESVSQKVIDTELEVGKDLARQEGKPEAMLDKIAQGRLGKFFKENTLMSQSFIKDSKITVTDYLKSTDKDLTVSKFSRLGIG